MACSEQDSILQFRVCIYQGDCEGFHDVSKSDVENFKQRI